MSGWLLALVILEAGLVGAGAIILYRSRTPEFDRERTRARIRPIGRLLRRRPGRGSVAFVRALHGALALVGFGGFLLAVGGGPHRKLGGALVGLAAITDLPVAIWLKHLRKEKRKQEEVQA